MANDQIAERRGRRRAAERRRRAAVRRRNALAGFALAAFATGLLIGAAGTAKRPASTRRSGQPNQLASSSAGVPVVEDYRSPTPILMYHGIGAAPAGAAFPRLFVPEPEFKDQVDWLADHGYHAVTLEQLFAAWTDGKPIVRRPIVISFDDGLRSQYVGALPVLQARRWPAVLNLELTSIEQGELTDDMVSEMIASGWEVDSHTITHADLSRLDGAELRHEVAGSRHMLAERFDIPVDFFCYPGGDYDAEALEAVRDAGYLGATTTEPGLASPDHPFELARIRVEPGEGPAGIKAAMAPNG